MKQGYFFLTVLLLNCRLLAQPVISSFAPASATVGATVIIAGNNFSAIRDENTVFFGSVKAAISSASSTSLSVAVPAGANYQPISITVNGLTAFAARPFIVTQNCPGGSFGVNDFANKTTYAVAQAGMVSSTTESLVSADFDGDGRNDIAVIYNDDQLAVYRNRGSNEVPLFDAAKIFITGNYGISIAAGDLNGDGLPDMAVANYVAGTVSVLINQSTAGNIVFKGKADFETGIGPTAVVISDFNNDHVPDLAVTNFSDNTISVLLQIRSGKQGRYALKSDFIHPTYGGSFSILDGSIELKSPDPGKFGMFWNSEKVRPLLVSGSITSYTTQQPVYAVTNAAIDSVYNSFRGGTNVVYSLVSSYPNRYDSITKTIYAQYSYLTGSRVFTDTLTYLGPSEASVSFASKIQFAVGINPSGLAAADLDADGKIDIIVSNEGSANISLLRNTGTGGNAAFAPHQDYASGPVPKGIAAGDLDGDNKIDLAVTNNAGNTVAILKNASSPGTFSFLPALQYAVGQSPNAIAIGDMNGDGKPDICTANKKGASVSILKNGSTAGTIAFAGAVHYPASSAPYNLALSDMDGDGKMDITLVDSINFSFSILKNKINDPAINYFSPRAGSSGITVTITGTGFIGATSVTVNATAATSFAVVSDAVITAIVAPGSGPGKITVTTACGKASAAGFIYTGVPAVDNFNPKFGPAGTIVTIEGSGFSRVTGDNIVYFGAGRATILSATENTLTVKVPDASTFVPVSVTVDKLTGYSNQEPFIKTFGCGSPLSVISFADAVTFLLRDVSWHFATADLDGDGKVDLACPGFSADTVSVFRNVGISGTIALAPSLDLHTGSQPDDVVLTDFDGDGKPDMIVVNSEDSYNNLSILKNTSTPGTISFAQQFTLPSGTNGDKLVAGDMDNDGKTDLIVSMGYYGKFSFLKNTSSNGNISFDAARVFDMNELLAPRTNAQAGHIKIADLNDDGYNDLVVSDFVNNKIYTVQGLNVDHEVSFIAATEYSLPANASVFYLFVSDMDNDGRPDIVVQNYRDTSISIFKNSTSAGVISFATPSVFSTSPGYPYEIAVDDMDGDGKPDVICTAGKAMAIIKNNSTPGLLSFAPRQFYPHTEVITNVSVADMDNDGKPDMIGAVGGYLHGTIAVFKNQLCEQIPFCPGGNNILQSSINGTVYQWQANSGNGYSSITNTVNYSGVNTGSLALINIPSAWYGYKYRCITDGIYSTEMAIQFINTWTGAVSTSWEDPQNWSCGQVPDDNTDVYINNGTVVVNFSTVVRSVRVRQGAHFTIMPGTVFTVLH